MVITDAPDALYSERLLAREPFSITLAYDNVVTSPFEFFQVELVATTAATAASRPSSAAHVYRGVDGTLKLRHSVRAMASLNANAPHGHGKICTTHTHCYVAQNKILNLSCSSIFPLFIYFFFNYHRILLVAFDDCLACCC